MPHLETNAIGSTPKLFAPFLMELLTIWFESTVFALEDRRKGNIFLV